MQIYFTGIESPSHLAVLKSCGVERVAVSVNNLAKHTQKYDLWPSKDKLSGLDWIIYADSPTCPVDPVLELIQGADVAPEGCAGPVNWSTDTWIKDSDLLFLPMWDGRDNGVMRIYSETYEAVILPDAVCDNQIAVKTAKSALPPMGTLAGLTGRSKSIHQYDLVLSGGWWAVQKHGETQVWSGNRFIRLNSDDKHAKRARYADAIEALGVDVAAVLADDPTETVRCAILSWLAYEKHLNQVGANRTAPAVVANGAPNRAIGGGRQTTTVASGGSQTRQQLPATAALMTIPVMQSSVITTVTKGDDDSETKVERRQSRSLETSSRQCTTCKLSATCPAFSPGADFCSIGIPVTIRSKDELQDVMSTLIELQTQRAMFGVFSEQVLGEPDIQVGKEMDRTFQMMERAKTITEGGGKFRVTVEGSGGSDAGNMGLISRLFGSEAGTNARMLDNPIVADDVAHEVLDAEVVGVED